MWIKNDLSQEETRFILETTNNIMLRYSTIYEKKIFFNRNEGARYFIKMDYII